MIFSIGQFSGEIFSERIIFLEPYGLMIFKTLPVKTTKYALLQFI